MRSLRYIERVTKGFSLKDQLFNAKKIEFLSGQLSGVYGKFPSEKFKMQTLQAFPQLELKERIVCVREALRDCLPQSYVKALGILMDSLPPPCDPQKSDNDFGDFIFAPYGDFVAAYGVLDENFLRSLQALKEITTRFSMEDSIRYFLRAHTEPTLKVLEHWAEDPHYHVRRLCSEGLRPSLPWSKKLGFHYSKAIPILEKLYRDPTRYVTRSVANHLNDISKLDASFVISTLRRWKKSGGQAESEMNYMFTHALRTLVKKKHMGALNVLGFCKEAIVEDPRLLLEKTKLSLGDPVLLSFSFTSPSCQALLLDIRLEMPSKSGKPRTKIFKWKKIEVNKGEYIQLKKIIALRENLTTRVYYPGKYSMTIQVNGADHQSASFYLK